MKTRITVSVLGVFFLGMLAVAGCATRSGVAPASFPAPEIGMVADEKLRVVEIVPGSAAEKAGLQVGDVLLDLTWIPSDTPAYVPEGSDVIQLDGTAAPADGEAVTNMTDGDAFVSPILPKSAPAIPPAVESYIDKDTVPFTEVRQIKSLATYGVPLKLRLMREDQVLELTIVPVVPQVQPLAPGEIRPTITPVMPPYAYY